jgi:hypothetical protein
LIIRQMIRVISSPSISTIGCFTLIFAMLGLSGLMAGLAGWPRF